MSLTCTCLAHAADARTVQCPSEAAHYVPNRVGLAPCSAEVEHALLALLRMGDCAAEAQEALCRGLMRELNLLLDAMPTEGSSAMPAAAQVLGSS